MYTPTNLTLTAYTDEQIERSLRNGEANIATIRRNIARIHDRIERDVIGADAELADEQAKLAAAMDRYHAAIEESEARSLRAA